MTRHEDTAPAVWPQLRALTAARIGLGRTGASIRTKDLLDFRLSHALARDAVAAQMDEARLQGELAAFGLESVVCSSAAADRRAYLLRPDFGRRLSAESQGRLAALRSPGFDLGLVLADGLSALAVQRHAPGLVRSLLAKLADRWSLAPAVVLHNGRVAAGDAVARALGLRCVLVLIGERPGLSSPDSLGAYLSWNPSAGISDADRNCVSNIRPEGLPVEAAADKIAYLLDRMRQLGFSGVRLKDDMADALEHSR